MKDSFTADFRIFRYDPDHDTLPRYLDYRMEYSRNEQLLDILIRIKEDIDSSLSFRRSCRHGICGSCAVNVNNKPVLACKTPVADLTAEFGDTLIIAPLDMDLVLKDLIIDREDYWQKMSSVKPYLEPLIGDGESRPLLPSSAVEIADADYCIQCGSCYYACPVVKISPDYLGPAAFVKTWRMAADVRDFSGNRLELVNGNVEGIWDCVKCLQCVESCPKGLSPYRMITMLRERSIDEKVEKDGTHLRHILAFREFYKVHRNDKRACPCLLYPRAQVPEDGTAGSAYGPSGQASYKPADPAKQEFG